jgi:hypothetical protein
VGFAAIRHKNPPTDREARESDLILANTLVRKRVFEKVGGFDQDQVPCEENLFYFRVRRGGHKTLYATKIACAHPAKPIFFPWARKVFFYATGRGAVSLREPKTFRVQYAIPSVFVLTIPCLGVLSPFLPPAGSLLLAIGAIYGALNLANALYIFLKSEKNPLILIASPIATFIVHASYGLGFLTGLLRFLIGKRRAVKMPSKH